MFRKKFPAGFDEWCARANLPGDVQAENYIGFAKGRAKEDKAGRDSLPGEFFQNLTKIDRKKKCDLTINGYQSVNNFEFIFSSGLPVLPTGETYDDFHQNIIEVAAREVRIEGVAVRLLRVPAVESHVYLKNCYISQLGFDTGAQGGRSVYMENSWVGTLSISGNAIQHFSMKGGGIGTINCPAPEDNNPIKGSVIFDEVFFPTKENQTKLFGGSQPYRHLRAHLEKLNNGPMASLLRKAELRSERYESDRWLTKALNFFYDKASGYGGSPGLPLIWAALFYSLAVWFAFQFDTGTTPLTQNLYSGWRANLCDVGVGHIWRAFYLPAQSMISPAGLFSARSLVTANTALGGAVFTVAGLVMDVLIFLSILAIRKRFKL